MLNAILSGVGGTLFGILIGIGLSYAVRLLGPSTSTPSSPGRRGGGSRGSRSESSAYNQRSMEMMQESAMVNSAEMHDQVHRSYRMMWRDIKLEKELTRDKIWLARITFGSSKNVLCVLKNTDSSNRGRKGRNTSVVINESAIEELHMLGRHPRIVFTFGFAVVTKEAKRLVGIDAHWLLVSEYLEHGTMDALLHRDVFMQQQRGVSSKKKEKTVSISTRPRGTIGVDGRWTSSRRWRI